MTWHLANFAQFVKDHLGTKPQLTWAWTATNSAPQLAPTWHQDLPFSISKANTPIKTDINKNEHLNLVDVLDGTIICWSLSFIAAKSAYCQYQVCSTCTTLAVSKV